MGYGQEAAFEAMLDAEMEEIARQQEEKRMVRMERARLLHVAKDELRTKDLEGALTSVLMLLESLLIEDR